MSHFWIESLGWAATCVFVASYFFAKPSWLRGFQMVGALLWMTYGILIGPMPVIIANCWFLRRRRGRRFANLPALGTGSPA